jgi:hypothetical protein
VMAVGLNAVRWVSTVLRIPDPDIYPSRIPDLGSLPDLTTTTTNEE